MSERPVMGDPPLVRDLPEATREGTPDPILQRLEDLEYENGRLRRFGSGLLAAGAVVLVAVTAMTVFASRRSSTVGAAVHVQRIVLEDVQGRVRGTWGVTEEGAVQLALTDSQGKPRVRVSVLNDGSPGLVLLDGTGQPRAALGLLVDGTMSLVFADREGRGRAVLGLSAAGAPSLALADQRGVTRAGLGVATNGKATLTMDESEGGP